MHDERSPQARRGPETAPPGAPPGEAGPGAGPPRAPGAPRPSARRSALRALAGALVAAACLWLALRGVEPDEALSTLARADLPLLGLAVLLLLAAQVLRAASWTILAGGRAALPLHRALRLLLVGNLANLVVPFRGGEVARVWILGRRGGIGPGRAATVVVVERTVDLLLLVMLVGVATALVGLPDWLGRGAWKLGLGAGLAAATLAALLASRGRIEAAAARLGAGRASLRAAGSALARLAEGLAMLRVGSALRAAAALVSSWSLVLAGLELRLRAFGIETPPGGALAVLAAGNVATSFHLTPAGLGVFEYATVLVLERLSVPSSTGLAFAMASHGLTILVVGLAGGVALALDAAARRSPPTGRAASSRPPGRPVSPRAGGREGPP